MPTISDNQNKTIRRMFADSVYNLALSENRNQGLDESSIAYYRGILVAVVSGIMGFTGRNWYDAMVILHTLLPLAHVSLNLVLPDTWRDVVDHYGKIDVAKCRKLGATL